MNFHDNESPKDDDMKKTHTQKNHSLPETLRLEDLFRFDSPPDSTVTIGGKDYINFSGEGNLGLQSHPEVLAATCEAVLRYGTSTAISRKNYTPSPIMEVERLAARIFNTDRAFYVADSQRLAELLLESIRGSYDQVLIEDSLPWLTQIIKNGSGQIGAIHEFEAGNASELKQLLQTKLRKTDRPLVIAEGVSGITGLMAPLRKYTNLLSNWHNASLWVDDSYGFGMIGRCGRGTLEQQGLSLETINRTRSDQELFEPFGERDCSPNKQLKDFEASFPPFISADYDLPENRSDSILKSSQGPQIYWTASCTKGLGGYGAFLPGSNSFIERLLEQANRRGETLPPTPIAAATAKSLELTFTDSTLRSRLQRNTRYFKEGLRQLGFQIDDSLVPFVVIQCGSGHNMRRIQQILARKQFLVSYLPRQRSLGSSGAIRMTLFSTHTRVMLESFLKALADAIV